MLQKLGVNLHPHLLSKNTYTVRTLIFTCPLFYESIKITKFKGTNIKFQILENSTSLKNRCIQLNRLKGAEIIFVYNRQFLGQPHQRRKNRVGKVVKSRGPPEPRGPRVSGKKIIGLIIS